MSIFLQAEVMSVELPLLRTIDNFFFADFSIIKACHEHMFSLTSFPRQGAIHKIPDALGERGCLIRSHIVPQEGGGITSGIT